VAEFPELLGSGQVERLQALAARALAAWSLEDAELALLKYRENAIFSVSATSGERFVLRVHRPGYRSDAHICSEVQWMEALGEAGIATPDFVRTRGGELLVTRSAPGVPEARQCDLMTWVEGRPLGTLEGGVSGDVEFVARSYTLLGSLGARIHEHARSWPRPTGFVRPEWTAETLIGENPTFGRWWELDCVTSEQLAILERARSRARQSLEAFGRTPDRFGLLHGDLLPENVLMGDAGPRLIDFDDCGDGWYVFELATGLFPLIGNADFEVARDAYVEGYRHIRAFPEEQLALLDTSLVARSLSYLGWPAGRREMEEAAQLSPILAEIVTGIAERYLAGKPLGTTS